MTGKPYGTWPSPLSVEIAVSAARSLREPRYDGVDLYWIESRPDEGGRSVVMTRQPDGGVADVTAAPFDARTRVHEYGGGSYAVSGGILVFSNFEDGRLYLKRWGEAPEPLTPEGALRYADLEIDRGRSQVLCVLEDHREEGAEPSNSLVAVSLTDGQQRTLVDGADFFSHPRLDPDGQRMAWLCWNRPDMPWDSTELWVGTVMEDGTLEGGHRVAGGNGESIAQPAWAPDGSLLFASDRTGWWNLYRWREGLDWMGATEPASIDALAPMEAEFAGPQWVFGRSWFACLPDGRIAAVANRDGLRRLLLISEDQPPRQVPLPWTELGDVVSSGRFVAAVAASPTEPAAVVSFDPDAAQPQVVRRSSELPLPADHVSGPESIQFPSANGRTAHALLYRPRNPGEVAPPGELPPLLVISHGGPTSQTTTQFSPTIQFFTTRGFAVVDVDYGGSSGYGRAYREQLNGRWGIVDLEDCTNAARWLVAQGLVDGARLAIRGGSAGGYTTLCALCFTDLFACGVSSFGVGDLEALARDTHKFESRYLDHLVAPYPAGVEVYRSRSPIHFADRIRCPVLVLQGADDHVVPKAQADLLVQALERSGTPCAYLLFQGEGHGFRRAENLQRALEAELSFYGQVLGFTPADALPPLEVERLASWQARKHDTAASAQDAARPVG
jgi:dipeptidyl aminopeptidase/acylaminoacyl peptidase